MSAPDEQLHPGPEITVWAPVAHHVEIEWASPDADGATERMEPKGDGWWRWRAPAQPSDAGAAAYPPLDYAFRIDGGEATPDPRSAWQPHGVHGRSSRRARRATRRSRGSTRDSWPRATSHWRTGR